MSEKDSKICASWNNEKDFSIRNIWWSRKFKNRKARPKRLRNKMNSSRRKDSICSKNTRDYRTKDPKFYRRGTCSRKGCTKLKSYSNSRGSIRTNCGGWRTRLKRPTQKRKRHRNSCRIRCLLSRNKMLITTYRRQKAQRNSKGYSKSRKKRNNKALIIFDYHLWIIV